MAKERILVIEDEEDILELVRFNFAREGYVVTGVGSGEDGLRQAQAQMPDLIVLDLMLPGMDGLEVCRILKQTASTNRIPIVICSAKGEETDVVTGLELGADDYVVKPFSPKVLVARVRNVLRRRSEPPANSQTPISIGEITINPGRFEVKVSGQPVVLTPTEFSILHYLARHPGWVFTRYQIVDAVKGEDYPVTDRAVDVQIVGLRRKLGDSCDCIETVRGVGYRFRE